MHPILFTIPIFGGIHIYTYGVLVATAFTAGVLWTCREAKFAGVSADRVIDLSFYLIIAALAGSRIVFIIVEWEEYASDPLKIFRIWEGGLVFYGGLIGAITITYWYIKKYKLSYLEMADVFMPGVALGHAFGRIGCFMAGCCYGRPSSIPWLSVTFPTKNFTIAPGGIPIYPTQLMESAAELAIFLFLIFMRRRKRFTGQIFFLYIIVYGITRSILELFRGDKARGFVIEGYLSTSQFVSAVLIISIICVYLYKRRKNSNEK